jgi:prephenate dehydratase
MGSKVLAKIYGLKLIEENLQDLHENFTSFLWVERNN